MSSSAKWATGTLAAALWVAWLAVYTESKMDTVGVVHMVITEALRMAASLSSVVFALTWMVAPVIATAQVWREIGAKEREQHCDCSAKRAAKLHNIIPTNFNGSISRIDPVRHRDI